MYTLGSRSTLLAQLQEVSLGAVLVVSSPASQTLPAVASTGPVPGKATYLRGSITVVKVESSARPSLPVRRSSRLRTIKDAVAAMPSFLRHSRSYSYPPCIDSVEFDAEEEHLPDIDENPFAHFLTPLNEEDDPYDGLAMSAGIVVQEGQRASKTSKFTSTVADKWARYVKTNHTQIHTRYHPSTYDEDDESYMQLDDDRLLDTPHTVSQLTGPPSPSPPRITITEPTRGRAQELVTRKTRPRYRSSRTLSGHRHSWREPSPDLFTVDESEEEESPTVMRRIKSKSRKAKDGAERRRPKFDIATKSRL